MGQHTSTFLLLLFLLAIAVQNDMNTSHVHKIPLNFTSDYLYYAHLHFGSQHQQIEMQIDTGSTTMAVFCDTCQNCNKQKQFKTASSSSFQNATCGFVQKYFQKTKLMNSAIVNCLNQCTNKNDAFQCKDEVVYGQGQYGSYFDFQLSYDQMGIEGDSTVGSSFGCIYRQHNFQNGIWGLSSHPSNQFLQILHNKDTQLARHPQKIFTICTNGSDSVLNIGGIDSSYHIGKGVKVKADRSFPLWWKIQDQDIGRFTVNGTVIRNASQSLGQYGVIVDSGTDLNLLPCDVIDKLTLVFDSFCNPSQQCSRMKKQVDGFEHVYKVKNADLFFSSLPPIEIQMGGRILQTPFSNYFWRLDSATWALAVECTQKYGFPNSILGSIWMNNFDVAFDWQNMEITFFDIHRCSKPKMRMLQTEQNDDIEQYDPYELPTQKSNKNHSQSLWKVKVKTQKNLGSWQKTRPS